MDQKAAIARAIRRHGGLESLPDAPDGPILPTFEPKAVARAIHAEILRARANGWPRISIHLDLVDALALARALEVRR